MIEARFDRTGTLGTRRVGDRYYVTKDSGATWAPVRRWLAYRVANWMITLAGEK